VDGFAGEGIQVERHRRGEGFPFAGLHFRDRAVVHGDPAEDLDIVRDHVPFLVVAGDMDVRSAQSAAGILDSRVGFGKKLVEGFPLFNTLAEFPCFAAKLFFGQGLEFLFEAVDFCNDFTVLLEQAALGSTKNFLYKSEHGGFP
jgi:hypothetical protein